MNIPRYNIILKVVAIVLIVAFSFQNILWANPEILRKRSVSTLQIQPLSHNIITEGPHLRKLVESRVFAFVKRDMPEYVESWIQLCTTFSGEGLVVKPLVNDTSVVMDFGNAKKEKVWYVPCSVEREDCKPIQYIAIVDSEKVNTDRPNFIKVKLASELIKEATSEPEETTSSSVITKLRETGGKVQDIVRKATRPTLKRKRDGEGANLIAFMLTILVVSVVAGIVALTQLNPKMFQGSGFKMLGTINPFLGFTVACSIGALLIVKIIIRWSREEKEKALRKRRSRWSRPWTLPRSCSSRRR